MKRFGSTRVERLRSPKVKIAEVRGTGTRKYLGHATTLAALLVIALVFGPVRAAAQTSAESQSSSPSFEAGATVGVLGLFPTFGARVTTVFSPRFAVEGVAELVPWILDDRGGTHFLFQSQLRQSFHQGLRGSWHATYGATFFSRYEYRPASAFPGPRDSSVVVPERRSFSLDDFAIHVGIGGERRISPRVALRWDLQAVQVLRDQDYPWPRATFGVTWK
jgi:hypothetical protein